METNKHIIAEQAHGAEQSLCKMINKKGMSTIIVTLLLVMFSIVLIGVVFGFLRGTINKQMSTSGSCFGNYGQVTLNSKYSCYENSSSSYVQFSINVGDVDIEGISVSISSVAGSHSFIINNTKSVSGLTNYNGGTATLPDKNSGITYKYTWTDSNAPESIEISPIISGTICPSSSSIPSLSNCALLA